MNSRKSYLDSMNAGRRRRGSTSLDHLNRTLDELEGRIARAPARRDERQHAGTKPERSRDVYRQLATDFERSRMQEDGLKSAGRIAGELHGLHEDLRHQMTDSLHREFAALRGEIERGLNAAQPTAQIAELTGEFERLAAMIHEMSGRTDDRQLHLLRLEMEEVKNALGKLAREETVRSADRRWDDFDRRWDEIAARLGGGGARMAPDPALDALGTRLEEIGEAIGSLPDSVVMRSLEDKLRVLAASVDQFAHHQDRIGPEALDAIEERLNEITRAIAAAGQPVQVAPEHFERIEARISALAAQIGELIDDHPVSGLVDHMATLNQRIDDIARRVEVPEHVVERLAEQIAVISQKLDTAPPAPDLDRVFQDIEGRFAHLSDMLARRHEDAMEQGQSLFRELERRLDEVAGRIDGGPQAPAQPDSPIIDAIDARFEELAARLEDRRAHGDDSTVRSLEARLDDISARLEESAKGTSSVDAELMRSLEAQVSALSHHLSHPSTALPQLEDVRPRIDDIEKAMLQSRQDIVDAARRAAEEAVRSLAGSAEERAAASDLAEELKSLEQLTRKSDDRNARTFEAIHDTLLKIVERLGSVEGARADAGFGAKPAGSDTSRALESAPSIEPALDSMDHGVSEPGAPRPQAAVRTAAMAAQQAAADAARTAEDMPSGKAGTSRLSVLGDLARKITTGRSRQNAAGSGATPHPANPTRHGETVPDVELDQPLDARLANQPIEPGAATPDLNAIMRRVRDERAQQGKGTDPATAKSDFIAAARRAAQSAAAEAEMMKRTPPRKEKTGGFALGNLLRVRKKALMLGVVAVLTTIVGVQLGRSYLGGTAQAVQAEVELPVNSQIEEAAPEAALDRTDDAAPEAARVRVVDQPRADMAGAPLVGEMEFTEEAAADQADWLDPSPIETAALPRSGDSAEVESPARLPASADEIVVPEEAGPLALRQAAQEGDAKALFEIGNRYAEGLGMPVDMARAAQWYQRAAELGLAPAQYRVGNLHDKGIGVTRDVEKAKTWYQLAAAQGNASAMHNLAVLHAMGADGTVDNESAARWFVEAAELGVKDSQFNLGILTAKGVGLPQDLVEAYKWFSLVAAGGDRDAAEKRNEVAGALRPEQLEAARATAELWQARPLDAEANVVEIPEEWSDAPVITGSVDMRQAIRNIQTILNKEGFDAGTPDGVMGARTKSAIAAFQTANGMPATGEVDEALVRALLERR